jgi:hypothetical protein
VAGLHSLMLAAGVVICGFTGVTLANRWARFGLARRAVLVLGGAIALRTALLGGGQVGFLVAAVFLLLGWLRLRAARG